MKTLYEFQKATRNIHLSGADIILQAPPGAGKTRAALEGGLSAFERTEQNSHHEAPQRIVFSTPMRTLTQGQYKLAESAFKQNANWGKTWKPSIQTGEQPNDPLFEHKLIFATVDQVLASFLNVPYGLSRRLDNINAGAFIGSYLIFDEFHLYPTHQMMLSVLAMLTMLKGFSRFTLMSATFSHRFLKAIATELDAQIIADEPGTSVDRGMFHDVDNITSQQRTWQTIEGQLDAAAVQRLRGKRTLCVCNTVERACALYQSLKIAFPHTDIRLLHSRFYRADRRSKETDLLEKGIDTNRSLFELLDSEVILVATQIIEVGLDISCDVLLTECAPAASLVQRAGRCARRENERGNVYVFQPIDEGQVNYTPYSSRDSSDEDNLEEVCERTWDVLTSSQFNGSILRFPEEQMLIDQAHGLHDARFIDNLSQKIDQRIDEITQCMASRNDGYISTLIRKVTTVPLFIDSNPNKDSKLTQTPFDREPISVSRGQIAHAIKNLIERSDDAEGAFFGCVDISNQRDDDDGQSDAKYQWEPIRVPKDVFSFRYRWFCASTEAVSYSPDTGLILSPSTAPALPSPDIQGKKHEYPPFIADTYTQHLEGLYLAYTRSYAVGELHHIPLRDELLFPLNRLCARLKLDPNEGEQMLRLTLALHDIGKLNRPWQSWAQSWQEHFGANGGYTTVTAQDGPLAHTDYNPRDEHHRLIKQHFVHAPRGPHAVESAEASLPIIESATTERTWQQIIISAIARHHTPDADQSGRFQLARDSRAAISEVLQVFGFRSEADMWSQKIKESFDAGDRARGKVSQSLGQTTANYSSYTKVLLYLLFVRILRLADQRSGEYWRLYNKRTNKTNREDN